MQQSIKVAYMAEMVGHGDKRVHKHCAFESFGSVVIRERDLLSNRLYDFFDTFKEYYGPKAVYACAILTYGILSKLDFDTLMVHQWFERHKEFCHVRAQWDQASVFSQGRIELAVGAWWND